MRDGSVHLAHDWLVGMRGGEFVLDRLARQFGPTTLYTLVDNREPHTPAIDACMKRASFLQHLPGSTGRLRRWYLPLMRRAVESLRVQSECAILMSTSSAVMKAIRPPPGVPHICYCHSPARYIWGQTGDYAHGGGGGLRSIGLRTIQKRFRDWDRATCDRVTQFIANSTHTADKIRSYYDRETLVIHPPVRTEYWTLDEDAPREDFFLVVSALEPYKRVDLAIDAADKAGFRLKVAGSGTLEHELRSRAGSTVEMPGRVGDETLRDLYRRAKALIYPQLEDFGIIAVEAQACGCPVIAYGKGGALDSVTTETGVFFQEQSIDALVDAVERSSERAFDPHVIRTNAERFSASRFDHAIRHVVERIMAAREPHD